MSSPLPHSPLTVVVVSSDAAFRRLAGAALSRAGHAVHTAAATPQRLERLVRLRHPDVVVIDVPARAEPLAPAAPEPGLPRPKVLLVSEAARPGMLDKWGPVEALVAGVEDRGRARPQLKLIRGKR